MKRNLRVSAAITILIATLLLSTSLSLASTTPSTPVAGTWKATSAPAATNEKFAGANFFADMYNTGVYTGGPIVGTFVQNFKLIDHFADPKVVAGLEGVPVSSWPDCTFIWNDMVRVFTGSALGKSGTLNIRLECKGYGSTAKGPTGYELEGNWIILSGTGDLANLHGQGTWWHTKTITGLAYEGQVHFDP